MEVCITLQAALDRQQPWLDLAPLGFCYLVDFQSMTQINQQTQRRRRIQRRSDMAYPLVSGPLPKASQGWGTGRGGAASGGGTAGGGSSGALLGVGVSGSNSSENGGLLYPSGTLSITSLTPPGQPCACQQCMLVLSVKANAMTSQTLGRRLPPTKALSPVKSSRGTLSYSTTTSSISNSYSQTLPHGLSLNRSLSQERKNAAAFAQSLSMLTSNTANLSLTSNRPPPPSLPPPPPPPASHQQSLSMSSCTSTTSSLSVPTATLITVATSSTSCSSSSSASTAVPPQRSPACAAPLPPRASLAGLSRPALQRIAMAQSRALIASG